MFLLDRNSFDTYKEKDFRSQFLNLFFFFLHFFLHGLFRLHAMLLKKNFSSQKKYFLFSGSILFFKKKKSIIRNTCISGNSY